MNKAAVLDFTSALYLGLRHESWNLELWSQLTKGVPATLCDPSGAREVAEKLAALQGCEHGTLGASTLHLFWDLFGQLAHEGTAVYVDDSAYPILRWGAERAAARGLALRTFPHHDAEALRRCLQRDSFTQGRPILATDGFCPSCGQGAPLKAYVDLMRMFAGHLILDDTQALGILGHSPNLDAPYGLMGGGSLRRANISGGDVVLISSLAKAFGAPLAVLCGSEEMVRKFEAKSETRLHCSPPSSAHINAAQNALLVNEKCGDTLRFRLATKVLQFRNRLAETGLSTTGGSFPVQNLMHGHRIEAGELHARLLRSGVRTVVTRRCRGKDTGVTFLFSAWHTAQEIDFAAKALASAFLRRNHSHRSS
jgi:8-amino-7-oxononanoate synthase